MKNKHLRIESDLQISAMAESQLPQIELLSAYIDGEATPEESQRVQYLLDHDTEFKQQYLHLHQIRQGLQAMPAPQSQSHRHLSNNVFTRLRWQRSKTISLWGSGAIAALFIAGIVSNLPNIGQGGQFANRNEQPNSSTIVETATNPNQGEALVVALNRPVLQIPKMATADETP